MIMFVISTTSRLIAYSLVFKLLSASHHTPLPSALDAPGCDVIKKKRPYCTLKGAVHVTGSPTSPEYSE